MIRTYEVFSKKLVPCDLCEGKGTRIIEEHWIDCEVCEGRGDYMVTTKREVEPQYQKGSWLV